MRRAETVSCLSVWQDRSPFEWSNYVVANSVAAEICMCFRLSLLCLLTLFQLRPFCLDTL